MTTDIKFNAEEILEKLSPKIMADMEDKFTKQVITELDWSIKNNIQNLVANFFEEHIKDELKAKFTEMKPQILEQLAIGIIKTCEHMANAMAEKAVTNLSSGYLTSEIFGKLFR